MKKILKITPLILSLMFVLSIFTPAFAEGEDFILKQEGINRTNSIFEETDDPLDPGLPNVTIDDAVSWVERKGFEIVELMQKFMQPFAVIIFMGSAIMALVGVFGNGKSISKGLVGMFLALVLYSIGLYASEIMDIFLSWVRS